MPHWWKPLLSAKRELLDRQETLEADPLHDRHDVGESGPSQQAEVSFRREWFEHALEARCLVQDLIGTETILRLEVVVNRHRHVLEARIGATHLLEHQERAAPVKPFVDPVDQLLAVSRL